MSGNIQQNNFLYASVLPPSPSLSSDESPLPSPVVDSNDPQFPPPNEAALNLPDSVGATAEADPNADEGAVVRVRKVKPYKQPLSEPYRFLQLSIGGFGCICASTAYIFNLTSKDLQQKYNFTQSQMTTITTLGGVVGSLTLPFGFLYDYAGAKPIFLIGMILYPLGTILLGLAMSGGISGSVWSFSLYAIMQSVGTSMFDMGAVMTLMSIFPSNRGAVVAVMKTLTGLGAAILGTLQLAFFDSQPDRFFYFLGFLVCVGGLLSVIFVEVPTYQVTGYQRRHCTKKQLRQFIKSKHVYLSQKPPPQRFMIGFVVVLVLIFYFPVENALVTYLSLGHEWRVVFAVISVCILAFYPLMALPIQALELKRERTRTIIETLFDESDTSTDEDWEDKHDDHPGERERKSSRGDHERTSLLRHSRSQERRSRHGSRSRSSSRRSRRSLRKVNPDTVTDVSELEYIAPQYRTTFAQNLCTMRLWAFFWTLFCVGGAESVIIGNARFLYSALAGQEIDSSLATLLTVLQGVGSGMGRMIMSYIEVKTQKRPAEERIPITFVLFLPTVSIMLTVFSLVVLPYLAPQLLVLPFFFCALGNGFTAASLVIVIRTIYSEDPAKHYNVCFLAVLVSTIAINRYLYGSWYTFKADEQRVARENAGMPADPSMDNLCYGTECVFMPMMVMVALNITALLSTLFLHVDYTRFSKKKLAERQELQALAQNAENGSGAVRAANAEDETETGNKS